VLAQFIVLVLLLAAPRLALAFPNEPHGFGKARFGMSVAEVRTIYPAMTATGSPSPEAAALLAVYTLDGQSVYGLKPCVVTFQFNPERLHHIAFNCGKDIKVITALEKRFGDATQGMPNNAFWVGDSTTVSLNVKSRNFAFIDKSLNDEFQQRLRKYVAEHAVINGAPGAESGPTPAATPQ
jgi:hypothetical protein